MVKLVYGNQAMIKGFDTKFVYREAKGGVGADQHLVITSKEFFHRIDFAAIIAAGSIAEVPPGFDLPIGPKAKLT